MAKQLRLLHVVVQPVLVWDDGESLSPGPGVAQNVVPLADLDTFPASLRAELDNLRQQADHGGAGVDPHDHMKRGATADDSPDK